MARRLMIALIKQVGPRRSGEPNTPHTQMVVPWSRSGKARGACFCLNLNALNRKLSWWWLNCAIGSSRGEQQILRWQGVTFAGRAALFCYERNERSCRRDKNERRAV
jgi:hypothetical protein